MELILGAIAIAALIYVWLTILYVTDKIINVPRLRRFLNKIGYDKTKCIITREFNSVIIIYCDSPEIRVTDVCDQLSDKFKRTAYLVRDSERVIKKFGGIHSNDINHDWVCSSIRDRYHIETYGVDRMIIDYGGINGIRVSNTNPIKNHNLGSYHIYQHQLFLKLGIPWKRG